MYNVFLDNKYRYLLNTHFSNSSVFRHELIIQNPVGAQNAKPKSYSKSENFMTKTLNKWMPFLLPQILKLTSCSWKN